MTIDSLTACLRAIQPPAKIEEWVRAEGLSAPGSLPSPDYQQAVRDLLALLGVVSEDGGQIVSPTAYYFVQSLLYARRDGVLSPAVWQGKGAQDCTSLGGDLVTLLESHRLACSPSPTPVRVVEAVMAVIKARRGNEDVYLMQYDEKAAQFQPLGGKREAFDISSEAALTRELCEELVIDSLTAGQDFKIRPLLEHLKLNEVSASVHVITQYDHSFYHLTDVRFSFAIDHITRWIGETELASRKTHDGYAITSLYDDYMPGTLKTLPYSLTGSVS